MDPIARYTAVCLQTNINVVNEFDPSPSHVESQIQKNLARQRELIDWLYMDQRVGGPKLITFSEFSLTGVPESRKVEDYLKRAVQLPGWVTESLGEKAQEHECYIACNTFERDDDWPGMVFNTSFIVGPDGNVILRYRKNNNAQGGTAKNTNPGDIYDEYVAQYGGPESLFPVVDTPIGRLACVTCFDMRFPEIMRCLALRGAEVVIHLTAESHENGRDRPWTLSKQVRAWDNQVYLLSCNNGDTLDSKRPVNRQWGGSRIIGYDGAVLDEAYGQGETIVKAEIDLEGLRRDRWNAPNRNILATNRYWMYASRFADPDRQTWPLNSFSRSNPYRTTEQMKEIGRATLTRMYQRKQLVPPEETTCSNGRPYLQRYQAVSLQTDVHALRDHEIVPRVVEEHTRSALSRNTELIDWLCNEPRHSPKLICLSEFHLTGVPETRLLSDYFTLGVEIPGWVTEVYGAKAKEYGLHIAGGVFECDPEWPGRVFNTGFLIGPDGKVLIRYRKNNDFQAGIPCTTNPGDMYDLYANRYDGEGGDPFFPVVDTELGRLGMMICYDIRMAEVPRMLALNGVEVILHPTAESSFGAMGDSWQLAKRIRAFDNASYMVSTNNGATLGSARPRFRQRAFASQIVDFRGKVVAVNPNCGESVITGEIDLAALRRYRANANQNPLTISRFGTYVPIYRDIEGWPQNVFSDEPVAANVQSREIAREAVARLAKQGVLVEPGGFNRSDPTVVIGD